MEINNNININTPIIIQQLFIFTIRIQSNINDLTLFEQYISLISSDTPHNALLDNLNLNPNKNHNIITCILETLIKNYGCS